MINVPPDKIIIRPPVESYSVLIPVTGGCSWDRCKFCHTYRGAYGVIQKYAIRPIEDVLSDIDDFANRKYHGIPVFLAGGNPTSAPTDYLVRIIKYVRTKLQNVPRISCYAKALDILRKSDDDLQKLAQAGLDIVYMGLESGSNKVLKAMKKGTNAQSMIEAGQRIMDAGIDLSLYIILGLGGKKNSDDHVKETARVLTEINPTIFRFRTLNLLPGSELWKEWKAGDFELLSPVENLIEERNIIANIGEDVDSQVFNDHISNYCSIETDNIKKDRKRFITTLDKFINDPKIKSMPRKNLTRM
ncbi:MAG: radical SAM protein [Candidatus Lokiarchaeota archaeon]|nr:radical SAM protein [Candidatus Lokiarchaeota archaeon]MBD3202082.1 radical SAM protein [Candidatus Lokiarchaeota archaeon]